MSTKILCPLHDFLYTKNETKEHNLLLAKAY